MLCLARASVFASFVLPLAAQPAFPPPTAPAGNPVTPDKALLGMALFFEEQLSSTSTVACATCHDLARGGVDARVAVHPGPDGAYGTADDIRGSAGVAARTASARPRATPCSGSAPR